MESLFLQILNMSITASWIVLAVCLLRFILKKAPKWVSVSLWGLVAFRLVCPFSFESVFSLLPSAQTIPSDIAMSRNPSVHTGIPVFNSAVNPVLQSSFTPDPANSVNPLQVVNFISAVVWIIGMVGMLLYAAVSFLRLRKKTKESVVLQGNVYLCDRIDTPFILGLFRPRIYLPSSMEETDVSHVLAHENAHLARRDHWWKPLGFLLLTVHWFNPVLWLAYVLLCRDIELACDEKVIRDMDVQNKKDYSSALINCSVSRKSIAACPLAFGEVGVKNRIKTVLHYKKPTLWILIAAVILSCIAAFCLLTNPVNKDFGGYEYRVQRYYYDNVIGADRANREMGERTYEIDASLKAWRFTDNRLNKIFTFVPVGTEAAQDLIDAVESTLPLYYRLLQAEQVYFREGWDGALREQGELNYYIIQYSDGSLIGGYIGSHDTVPGEVYKLQRIQKLSGLFDEVPTDTIEVKEPLSLDDVLTLSKKGEALTFADFGDHLYVETGSGLYIRIYEIDDMFTLTVGGAVPEEKLMYAYLGANDGTQQVIDIRFDDVQSFIDAHKDNPIVADIEEMSTVHDPSEHEPAAPTDLLLYEEADWFFSSMASIGEEKIKMLELTDDYTQQVHPLVRIESEDELQNFAAYVGGTMTRVVESFQINADGNKRFDAAFFEENELLLLYLESGMVWGDMYAYAGASLENDFLTLHIRTTKTTAVVSEQDEYLLNGHLLALTVPKAMLQSSTDVRCVVK